MADAVEYKPSKEGMKALLGSAEVLAIIAERASHACATANAMVSADAMTNDAFMSASRIDDKGFARASVYTANPHGYNACLSDNVLLKAMG